MPDKTPDETQRPANEPTDQVTDQPQPTDNVTVQPGQTGEAWASDQITPYTEVAKAQEAELAAKLEADKKAAEDAAGDDEEPAQTVSGEPVGADTFDRPNDPDDEPKTVETTPKAKSKK